MIIFADIIVGYNGGRQDSSIGIECQAHSRVAVPLYEYVPKQKSPKKGDPCVVSCGTVPLVIHIYMRVLVMGCRRLPTARHNII